ncbi:hypothetical protein [Clostridium estertheticum]|uniref:hypothetical protein n=1 Tax=Clostridium estertheticum TaxID=238834 RepID=UPI001CF365B8|nr:hypothetical protein [Clostridium estertheticum]MCB2355761.1 hypothetical protein [Clostridium estertheticum]WAG39347.1 hypothetical protein LL065_13655 [Clostridium estertheticum]
MKDYLGANTFEYNNLNQQVNAITKEGNTLVSRYDTEGLRCEIEENETLTKLLQLILQVVQKKIGIIILNMSRGVLLLLHIKSNKQKMNIVMMQLVMF